jgi:hypothetical protein
MFRKSANPEPLAPHPNVEHVERKQADNYGGYLGPEHLKLAVRRHAILN